MEASSINSPHPDDQAAAAFFDDTDDEESTDVSLPVDEPEAEEEPARAEPRVGPTPEAQEALEAVREKRQAAAEPTAAEAQDAGRVTEDPTPPAESDGPTEDPSGESSRTTPLAGETADPQPAAEPAAADANDSGSGQETAADDGEGGKTQGTADREYIVFQKVPLTERVLKHLLKLIEEGNAPEPRVAFFELHRSVKRNDRQAIADAYNTHKGVLGEKCDLAAVSSRSWKERHVEPRQVVRDNLSIT